MTLKSFPQNKSNLFKRSKTLQRRRKSHTSPKKFISFFCHKSKHFFLKISDEGLRKYSHTIILENIIRENFED